MQRTLPTLVGAASLFFASMSASAHLEKLSDAENELWLGKLSKSLPSAPEPLARYVNSLKQDATKQKVNAARVLEDLSKRPSGSENLAFYAVPAMSELQRLPDAYPVDGSVNSPVRILAAKDEYEPGSFLIYPYDNLGKATLSLTPFQNEKGIAFPAADLDLKVVKVWYQNINGWYSYFGDKGLKLLPELLLNDEELICVDTKKEQNYARLRYPDGNTRYMWITPDNKIDVRYDEFWRKRSTFAPMTPEFRDAPTLQPVTLKAGEFKQFFLTAHTRKNTPEGIYRGAVKVTDAKGKLLAEIPVLLRVLSFELPEPKNWDLTKDYQTSSYTYCNFDLIMEENGGDFELSKRQFEAYLKNHLSHNQKIHWTFKANRVGDELLQIDIMRKAGMKLNPYLGGFVAGNQDERVLKNQASHLGEFYDRVLGHRNVFLFAGDEPPAAWVVKARKAYAIYQNENLKIILAGHPHVFHKAGYIFDWHNISAAPEKDETLDKWNRIGYAHVAWYARQHVGVENPAHTRRQYGLAPYLSGFSATCNYAHHFGPYNDRSEGYKPMVFAYGVYDGVIDTLAWEGYREGIDDIRYATLLKMLCKDAAQSKNLSTRYAGRKALQLMALLDGEKYDTASARLEIITRILNLQKCLADEKNVSKGK